MKRNTCIIDLEVKEIDYKDVSLLQLFVTKQGKILPRRVTRITVQQQRRLKKSIKQARILSLFPFVTTNSN